MLNDYVLDIAHYISQCSVSQRVVMSVIQGERGKFKQTKLNWRLGPPQHALPLQLIYLMSRWSANFDYHRKNRSPVAFCNASWWYQSTAEAAPVCDFKQHAGIA